MVRVGVDLGGTNIKVGLTDENYNIIDISSRDTGARDGAEAVAERVAEQVKALLEKNGVAKKYVSGVGVGSPGLIDGTSGVVIYSNNFGWENVPLKAMLEERLSLPVTVTNDANCAVLGEMTAGSGKGCKNLLLLTLGTGVGSGIVVNGKILEGSGAGGVAGHFTLKKDGRPCTCGKRGCFEAYVSATALINETKRVMAEDPQSMISELCGGDPEKIMGETAFLAKSAGDPAATSLIDEYTGYLADGIGSLINIFRPEKVLLSGGICNQGEALTDPVNEKLKDYCFAGGMISPPRVETASLKNAAGIIGAAALIENSGR